MIFPLHHCCALRCTELIDPGEVMCTTHWNMVALPTMAQFVAPKDEHDRKRALLNAFIEVAMAEGDIYLVSSRSPDASRAQLKPPLELKHHE
jgi:hypothetical protein